MRKENGGVFQGTSTLRRNEGQRIVWRRNGEIISQAIAKRMALASEYVRHGGRWPYHKKAS